MSQYGFKLKLKFTISHDWKRNVLFKMPDVYGNKAEINNTIHYIAPVTMRDITNKGNLK